MPLDRAHITAASRVMLPAYVVLTLVFGAYYAVDPGGRLAAAPASTFQARVMPLWCWGSVMLVLAGLMIAAAWTKSRITFAYSLCCCAFTWGLWAAAIAGAIPLTANTSYLAPVLPLFVAVCCVASTISLIVGEDR